MDSDENRPPDRSIQSPTRGHHPLDVKKGGYGQSEEGRGVKAGGSEPTFTSTNAIVRTQVVLPERGRQRPAGFPPPFSSSHSKSTDKQGTEEAPIQSPLANQSAQHMAPLIHPLRSQGPQSSTARRASMPHIPLLSPEDPQDYEEPDLPPLRRAREFDQVSTKRKSRSLSPVGSKRLIVTCPEIPSRPQTPKLVNLTIRSAPVPHNSLVSQSTQPFSDFHESRLTLSWECLTKARHMIARQQLYYPFHPDKFYSEQANGGIQKSLVHQGAFAPLTQSSMQGKALVHWYIALRKPALCENSLEASPESWDPRGPKAIPISDILAPESGFNLKNQRDLMVHMYLVMYYRYLYDQRKTANPKHALARLGSYIDPDCWEDFVPIPLNCTFCGSRCDLEWTHVELFDRDSLQQEFSQNEKLRRMGKPVAPLHIGMLSVLTCTHLTCTNNSATFVPKKGAPLIEDYFCQWYTLQFAKSAHKAAMTAIIASPHEYVPGGLATGTFSFPQEDWQTRDLPDNTVRYLRIEKYFNKLWEEYYLNCRQCGGRIPYPMSAFTLPRTKLAEGRKGDICCNTRRRPLCSWPGAVSLTLSLMERECGEEWIEGMRRAKAMKRGGINIMAYRTKANASEKGKGKETQRPRTWSPSEFIWRAAANLKRQEEEKWENRISDIGGDDEEEEYFYPGEYEEDDMEIETDSNSNGGDDDDDDWSITLDSEEDTD